MKTLACVLLVLVAASFTGCSGGSEVSAITVFGDGADDSVRLTQIAFWRSVSALPSPERQRYMCNAEAVDEAIRRHVLSLHKQTQELLAAAARADDGITPIPAALPAPPTATANAALTPQAAQREVFSYVAAQAATWK